MKLLTEILPGDSDRSGGWDSLEPSMDIFSAGCVIAELFTEGVPLFDYAELLAFSVNQHNPNKVIDKIEDSHIRFYDDGLMMTTTQKKKKKKKKEKKSAVINGGDGI